MKILSLSLLAFGPFTDRTLELSQNPAALQLVYGPNEAGKSSTMRALLSLLYGVPVRTQDAHVHEMARLRVGATLSDEVGRTLCLVRRKGAKQTLLDAAGQPLPDGVLSPLLGGLDENLFRHMFGLDHERLREGGEALLAGRGHVGEGLFDAGLGARSIRALADGLRAELEALYKHRGKTPDLNAALDAWRAKVRQRKDAVLSPSVVADQKRALAAARERRQRLGERRRALLAEKSRLSRALQLMPLLAQLARTQAELGALSSPGALAAVDPQQDVVWLDERVRGLERRFGSLQKAAADLPALRRMLADVERRAEAARARLGPGFQGRAVDTPARTRLRQLAEQDAWLRRSGDELSRARAEHVAEQEVLAEQARGLQPAGQREIAQLAGLLKAVDDEDLVGQLSRLEADVAGERERLRRGLAQLGLDLAPSQLARLSLPDEARLGALEQRFAEHEQAQAQLTRAQSELQPSLDSLKQQRAALLAAGPLSSRSQLREARERRDQALNAIYERVSRGEPPSPVAVQQHAVAVRHADELADRLYDEVQRATELSRVDQALAALGEQQTAQREQARALAAREAALRAELSALLDGTGLSASHPRYIRGSLAKLAQWVERSGAWSLRCEERARLRARAVAFSSALRGLLGAEPEEEGQAGADSKGPASEAVEGDAHLRLVQALASARQVLAGEQERERALAALEQKQRELQTRLAAVAQRAEALSAQRGAWQARYQAELEHLGFPPRLSPDEVMACVDDVTALAELKERMAALRAQQEAHAREEEAFRQELAAVLAQHAAPAAEELTLADALRALAARVRRALEAERDRRRLSEQREKLQTELRAVGEGASFEELRAQLHQTDPDAVKARLVELDEELEALSDEIGDSDQEMGRLQAGLERLEQSTGAAGVAEEAESELSRVQLLTRRYLELRLALGLLSHQVERYRAAHQGPLLKRASELFPRLTLGHYVGLDVDYDDRDEPVLCCVRDGGKRVRVSGLSDGTRDQLYLALRLASIERFVDHNTPMPVILDDAFVHFDDQRAAAALAVLGELTGRTQVLFFTHHWRMVELARQVLPAGQLAVHDLRAPAGAPDGRDDGPLFSSP